MSTKYSITKRFFNKYINEVRIHIIFNLSLLLLKERKVIGIEFSKKNI